MLRFRSGSWPRLPTTSSRSSSRYGLLALLVPHCGARCLDFSPEGLEVGWRVGLVQVVEVGALVVVGAVFEADLLVAGVHAKRPALDWRSRPRGRHAAGR